MSEAENALEAVAPETEAAAAIQVEQDAPEAAEPSEEVMQRARVLGWKPPQEWKGDPPPRGFMTADEWVEKFANTPKEIEALKSERERERREFDERIKRIETANTAALERQRQQLQARMDAAVETGDVDSYKAAKREIAGLDVKPAPEQPSIPPETQAWIARNSWFGQDRIKTAVAEAAAQEMADRGVNDAAAQLAYVDQVLAQQFAAKPKPTHAAVDGGGIQPARRREKGVNDLPDEAKRAAKKFVADGIYKSEAEYAADYWKEFG